MTFDPQQVANTVHMALRRSDPNFAAAHSAIMQAWLTYKQGEVLPSEVAEIPLAQTGLPVRVLSLLENIGAVYVRDLAQFSREELLSHSNIGAKMVHQIEEQVGPLLRAMGTWQDGRDTEAMAG